MQALIKETELVGFTIYFDNIICLMMIDQDLHHQGLGAVLLDHAEMNYSAVEIRSSDW